MQNIFAVLRELGRESDDTGEKIELRVTRGEDEWWVARIEVDDGRAPTFDPRTGEVELVGRGQTAESAIAELDALCRMEG